MAAYDRPPWSSSFVQRPPTDGEFVEPSPTWLSAEDEDEAEADDPRVRYELSPTHEAVAAARRISGSFEEPPPPPRKAKRPQYRQPGSRRTTPTENDFPELAEFRISPLSVRRDGPPTNSLSPAASFRQSLSRSITALTRNREISNSPVALVTRMSTAWDVDGAAAAALSEAQDMRLDCTPYASLEDEDCYYGALNGVNEDNHAQRYSPHLALPRAGRPNTPGQRLPGPDARKVPSSSEEHGTTAGSVPTNNTYFNCETQQFRPIAPKPPGEVDERLELRIQTELSPPPSATELESLREEDEEGEEIEQPPHNHPRNPAGTASQSTTRKTRQLIAPTGLPPKFPSPSSPSSGGPASSSSSPASPAGGGAAGSGVTQSTEVVKLGELPPHKFPDLKRDIGNDYPLAPWLIKKKVFPATYRCPYNYARTIAGKHGVINYEIKGEYKGHVAVCFHGLNATRLTYEEVQTVLARYGYCSLSFDLYGHGLSSNPAYRNCCAPCFCHCSKTSTYSGSFYVQQANEVLELLGLQNARLTVIGFSMGGVIGAQFALTKLEQVDRIVFLSTAGMIGRVPCAVHALRTCRCCISALPFCICHRCCSAKQFARAKRGFVRKFTPDEIRAGVADALWQRMVWQLFVKKGVLEAFLGSVANVNLWDSGGVFRELGRSNIPVLILWGKDDVVAPASCAPKVKKCFPNSHLILFERCSHLLLNDQLQAATALILTFQEFPRRAHLPRWRWLFPFTPDGSYVPRESRCPEGMSLRDYLDDLKFRPRLFVRLPRAEEG